MGNKHPGNLEWIKMHGTEYRKDHSCTEVHVQKVLHKQVNQQPVSDITINTLKQFYLAMMCSG